MVVWATSPMLMRQSQEKTDICEVIKKMCEILNAFKMNKEMQRNHFIKIIIITINYQSIWS